uniref:Uncharacterized protein n=1 Tax=Glossina brevipalpis TaxID=37001 RepID=A0A1A9X326_9MUSC
MFTRTKNVFSTFGKSSSAICFTCNTSTINKLNVAFTVYILSTLSCAYRRKQQQHNHHHHRHHHHNYYYHHHHHRYQQQKRQYYYSTQNICSYRPLLLSMFAFILLFTYTNALATVTAPPPPPLAAALAAPVSSSILEQFTPNCSAVAHIFQTRGFDPAEMPEKPKNGK